MRDLLAEMDAALECMQLRGHGETIYYKRLQAKRDAVANGASYRIINVTQPLIACAGAMIATTNIGTNDQLVPVRGSLLALRRRLAQKAEMSATSYPSIHEQERASFVAIDGRQ
jgi:hypothetical protein